MNPRGGDEAIELRPARIPASETTHRPFLVTSLVMATFIGFVLGIHVPLGRLMDTGSPERTADLIQAHGQVQLLGFAGLFVMGVSLRLMPRFASSRIAFMPLVPLTLCLIAGGLLARALIMPWLSGDAHAIVLIASVYAVLLGSACFLLIVAGTLTMESRRFDASSLAFILGALMLFAASTVSAVAAMDTVVDGGRSLAYLTDNAVLQLQLFGFIFAFILGVALRAIPTMLGIERPGRGAARLAVLLVTFTAVLAAALLYIEYVSYAPVARVAASLAFLGLGAVLVVLVWLTGVVRQAANRIRPASQASLWVIRSAVVWMLLGALGCIYFGAAALADSRIPSQTDFDAVRHALGVGVITMLIIGMALMILPEVAMARQSANRQKQLAFGLLFLLNSSAVLRVLPSLVGDSWSADTRNLSMAVAGSLAEAALIVFAIFLLRLIWRQRTS